MPTFRKSSPAVVARFDELAGLVEADRRQMFGYPACFLRGHLFMSLYEDSLVLRMSEEDRTEFRHRYDAAGFEPMPGRPMKEYVVVPETLRDADAVDEWVRRAFAYADQLPAKKPRKKA